METQPYNSLLIKPNSVKESIDWVLRATGWDNNDQHVSANYTRQLAVEVSSLLEEKLKVQAASGKNTELLSTFKNWLKDDMTHIPPRGPITEFAKGLKDFIGYVDGKITGNGIGLRDGYISAYNKYAAKWEEVMCLTHVKKKQAADIFIDAVIYIVIGLSFLFWKCRTEWSAQSMAGDSNANDLKDFLEKMGYVLPKLNTGNGKRNHSGEMVANKLRYSFSELEEALSVTDEALTKAPQTYNEFLRNLKGIADSDAEFIEALQSGNFDGQKQALINLGANNNFEFTDADFAKLKVETLSQLVRHYPLYKLCCMAYAYKLAADPNFIDKAPEEVRQGLSAFSTLGALGAAGAAAGVTVAYATNFMGFASLFAPFFT
ncbi:variant erythrocyte surface antigen-1 family protein [Babesia caballi]|uniref:Variant erythrocyte surface antigen-1 family protein n=1 Tax=Babesia caballi TaxID=5871 RepID=A0AAV4LVP1_BABCB|nr:variant erythrocyte surface antigen-1 family protein [Babesia caballi]